MLRANALIARNWLAERPLAEIIPFMRFILAQSRFVEMLVGREDDAFRIFETTNSRGRPLASEDVLRYALVEYATDDQTLRDDYLSRWDAFESELGQRGMRRFVGGWRARLKKGARPRLALHRIVIESFNTPAEARAFLDAEFSTDLATFRQIESADTALPDGPHKRRIDTILRSLDLVDFDDWLPIASELVAKGLAQPQRLLADLRVPRADGVDDDSVPRRQRRLPGSPQSVRRADADGRRHRLARHACGVGTAHRRRAFAHARLRDGAHPTERGLRCARCSCAWSSPCRAAAACSNVTASPSSTSCR